MSEEDEQAHNHIVCSVLREADYQPGSWLISDVHSTLTLYLGNTERMVESLKNRPHLAHLPCLMLVREQCPDRKSVVYAKPLIPGTFAFGGNWLWSSDSRFPANHPIRIHDAPHTG
jgi:hypothetical protein